MLAAKLMSYKVQRCEVFLNHDWWSGLKCIKKQKSKSKYAGISSTLHLTSVGILNPRPTVRV